MKLRPETMLISNRFVLALLIVFLVGCSAPPQVGMEPGSPSAGLPNPLLVSAPANATPTPTPFLPLAPTPTYIPTDYPTPIPSPTVMVPTPTPANTGPLVKTWSDYPGPTVWPDLDIPAPLGVLSQPKGQINIVLMGSDQRRNEPGFRTDTIVLLTLNPRDGTASLTSFPRDLYVYIPGWTMQRINTAFPHGGFPMLQDTFEYNFGVRPDFYMMISLWSFTQVVDNLGGIDVQVGQTLTDQRDGHGQYTVRTGQVRMDGETALWYVRSRYSTSDFDRTRRQQEVIQALFFSGAARCAKKRRNWGIKNRLRRFLIPQTPTLRKALT
jgi:polyisoprenyl-teichoic acid--peptidoglycan teichoic acid transferase